MKIRFRLLAFLVSVAMALPACSEPTEEEKFKSNFDEAVKAAEHGKESVKSPTGKRR